MLRSALFSLVNLWRLPALLWRVAPPLVLSMDEVARERTKFRGCPDLLDGGARGIQEACLDTQRSHLIDVLIIRLPRLTRLPSLRSSEPSPSFSSAVSPPRLSPQPPTLPTLLRPIPIEPITEPSPLPTSPLSTPSSSTPLLPNPSRPFETVSATPSPGSPNWAWTRRFLGRG
jgi:hypothetical protein